MHVTSCTCFILLIILRTCQKKTWGLKLSSSICKINMKISMSNTPGPWRAWSYTTWFPYRKWYYISHAAVTAVACFPHSPCGLSGWLLTGDPEPVSIKAFWGTEKVLGAGFAWFCEHLCSASDKIQSKDMFQTLPDVIVLWKSSGV